MAEPVEKAGHDALATEPAQDRRTREEVPLATDAGDAAMATPDRSAVHEGASHVDFPFFAHTACPHFPCHETQDPERFNCLFCFCPLYPLGEACGGDFTYTPSGVKDCSACLLPHQGAEGNAFVLQRSDELASLAKRPL